MTAKKRPKRAEPWAAAADDIHRRPPSRYDVAVRQIHCAGDESAQDERQQHPVLERDVGGKRKEIKANVLAVEGIALSVRHLVDEPENHVPVFDLARGHQDPKDNGDRRDEKPPWELKGRQQLGQRLGQCPDGRGSPVEGYGKPRPSAPGEPKRQRSVHPKEDGRAHENDEK